MYKHSRIEIVNNAKHTWGLKGIITPQMVIDMLLEKKDWPQKRDEYWSITDGGSIYASYWENQESERDLKTFGNCFRTEAEAIKMRNRIKKLLEGK